MYFLNPRPLLRGNLRQQSFKTVRRLGYQHRVNDWEKKFLVWTGRYKNVEDVPALLPASVVEKARNGMRIRIANLMMLSTALACLVVCKLGRNARDRGESLQKQNLEWHRRINEG